MALYVQLQRSLLTETASFYKRFAYNKNRYPSIYSFSDMKPVHFYRDFHLTSDFATYFHPPKKKFGWK